MEVPMRSILIPLAALALTACAPDSETVDAQVRDLVRAYVASTDITASLEMMDEAASSITGEGTILRGRDRIRDYANRHVAAIRDQRVTLGGIEVRRLGDGHALATAPFSATVSALPQVALAEGAVTLVLTKRDSGWKVVHEQYSYPTIRRP
jgi:uncharacterized protein (TIGR02246 family)